MTKNKQISRILKMKTNAAQYDYLRREIITQCRISRSTWHNWINGKTEIPFWASEKIDEILNNQPLTTNSNVHHYSKNKLHSH
jgi:hypothetical protein